MEIDKYIDGDRQLQRPRNRNKEVIEYYLKVYLQRYVKIKTNTTRYRDLEVDTQRQTNIQDHTDFKDLIIKYSDIHIAKIQEQTHRNKQIYCIMYTDEDMHLRRPGDSYRDLKVDTYRQTTILDHIYKQGQAFTDYKQKQRRIYLV